jgi:hypothetical protein
MLRPLKVLLSPDKEWEKAALNPPAAAGVFILGLIPLIAISLALEGYGLSRLGMRLGDFHNVPVPDARIVKYCVFYGVCSLLVILGGAQLLRGMSETFNLRATFGTYLTLMGLSYAPILLVRIVDAFPQINTWICWAIGVLLACRILYHGVALWLQPEQTKGFGILLVSITYIAILSGLVHFASVQVLNGKLLKNVHIGPALSPRD